MGNLLSQGLEVDVCEAGLRNGKPISEAILSVSERETYVVKQLGLHCQ